MRSCSRVRFPSHASSLRSAFSLRLRCLRTPGGLLDEASPTLRRRLQDGVQLPLTDDDVHLPADAGVAEQVLDVEQPGGVAVDRVLGAAVAEHGPRDGDLGVVDRQRAVGVVDGQQHLGPPERGPTGGAGEDDVLHLAAAQRLGALLAHHPAEGVDHVGLAGPVGSDDAGDARLEVQRGGRREGLEPAQREALEVHHGPFVRFDPTFVGWGSPIPLVRAGVTVAGEGVPNPSPGERRSPARRSPPRRRVRRDRVRCVGNSRPVHLVVLTDRPGSCPRAPLKNCLRGLPFGWNRVAPLAARRLPGRSSPSRHSSSHAVTQWVSRHTAAGEPGAGCLSSRC